MTTEHRTHNDWIGQEVHDSSGNKIGSVDQIYYDDETGRPDWITVSTGWFGTSTQFIPIYGSEMHSSGGISVEYTEDHIKDAPSIDGDAHLDADQEAKLWKHYGLDYKADADTYATTTADRPRADEGFAYADNRSTDTTSVVRAEEEVEVDKVRREAGRVRLRKYVVTEDVNLTVPVRKEVARVVREPVDGDATAAGASIDADGTDEEVVLSEEEIVVDKNVVAKERVGIETETITEQETVSETVRKEKVDVEGDVDRT